MADNKQIEIYQTEDGQTQIQVRLEGKRNVRRKIKIYNLDAIISVGYRVNSKKGTLVKLIMNLLCETS